MKRRRSAATAAVRKNLRSRGARIGRRPLGIGAERERLRVRLSCGVSRGGSFGVGSHWGRRRDDIAQLRSGARRRYAAEAERSQRASEREGDRERARLNNGPSTGGPSEMLTAERAARRWELGGEPFDLGGDGITRRRRAAAEAGRGA